MTKPIAFNSYPFGSAMPTRGWSDANRQYRYAFNGKEKDFETANDDFLMAIGIGARIYDERLGRWLALDLLMKLSINLSPYSAFGCNPILYIDIEGKVILIKNGNITVQYYDGQLFQANEKGEYTIPYTAGTEAFVDQVFSELTLLTNTPTGLNLVNDFGTSEFVLNISKAYSDENLKDDGNPHKSNEYYNDEQTIWYNTKDKTSIPTEINYKVNRPAPNFIVLGHEMAHAQSHKNGTNNEETWATFQGGEKKTKDEIYASHIENLLRSENNLPLRTFYTSETSTVKDPNGKSSFVNLTQLIDRYGNSLYYYTSFEVEYELNYSIEIDGRITNFSDKFTISIPIDKFNYNTDVGKSYTQ